MWKTVSLRVEPEFELDEWYERASPREIGALLHFSCSVSRFIEEDAGFTLNQELTFARDDATREAIRKTLEEASKNARTHFQEELNSMKTSLLNVSSEKQQLQEEVLKFKQEAKEGAEDVLNLKLEHATELSSLKQSLNEENAARLAESDKRLIEKEHVLKLEMEKLKCFESHLLSSSKATLEATKKEMALEHAHKCDTLQTLLSSTRQECEELKLKQQEVAQSARQDEISKASQSMQKMMQDNNAAQQALSAMKQETEQKLVQTLTEKMEFSERTSRYEMEAAKQISALEAQIKLLQDPMSRGNYGEFDVAQTIRELGFHVEDTSSGERKMEGHMDLLIKPSEQNGDGMRIAIEVKNKKTIKKATDDKVSKQKGDIDDDIQTFVKKARLGVEKDIFDAAIFVSIRAHTKMGSPVALEMIQDRSSDQHLSPIAFIGPERGKHAQPLSQDQLEAHVYMMFNLLEKLQTIKTDILTNALADTEKIALQKTVDTFSNAINATFSDLRKLEHSMTDMKHVVTTIKCNCIHMFRNMYSVNSQIPWLNRHVSAGWMPQFEKSKVDALTLSEANVWNRVSMNKTMIENSIGKDAMMLAIRNEIKRDSTDCMRSTHLESIKADEPVSTGEAGHGQTSATESIQQ